MVLFVACRAAPRPPEPVPVERPASTDDPRETLARVFDDLLGSQDADGSWRGESDFAGAVAGTALAALALTRDSEPSRQDSNEEPVRRGVKWLVVKMRSGTWSEPGGAPVSPLVHALAATAMAEGYGKSKSFLLRPYAQKAVDLALAAETPDDAWARGWRLVALCSAETAGLKVPARAIDEGANALDEFARTRADALAAHAPGALRAVVSICRTRGKSADPSGLAGAAAAPAALPPDLALDASPAALDHVHLGLRALAGAGEVRALWSAEIARSASVSWNETPVSSVAGAGPGGEPLRDVAWRARLALCLVEAVRPAPGP